MESRIRAIYILTIIASVALFVAEFLYVSAQYKYNSHQYQEEMMEQVVEVFEEEYSIRKAKADAIKRKGTTILSYKSNKKLILDTLNQLPVRKHKNRIVLQLDETLPNDVNVVMLSSQLLVNSNFPLDTAKIKRGLQSKQIEVEKLSLEKSDTTLWKPMMSVKDNFLRSKVTITYPTGILNKDICLVTFPVYIPAILGKMIWSLAAVLVLTILLVTCLIFQVLTIKKQRKIEELRRDYIHTTIHELKRPLMALKLCVSFVRNEKMMQSKESREDVLNNASTELNNLSSYFAKMRDVVMDERTEIPLRYTSFSIHKLLEDSVSRQIIPSEKHVEIKIGEFADFTLSADYDHMISAVCNLIENSIKYSTNKVLIQIISKVNENGMVAITVSDDGVGISSSDKKQIFEKFYRGSLNGNQPGMGLGLSYVKMIVEAHKGKIEVESKVGAGTAITIIIPQNR